MPPSAFFGGLAFVVEMVPTFSNVCPIFSSHRASSDVAFWGLYTTEGLKSFGEGAGEVGAGDVGDTKDSRDELG
jgi:hypothetical protein